MVKVFKSEKGKDLLLESYDKLLGLWGVDFEEAYVNTRYGATHVIKCGERSNPALLLFHGVGDNSALMWIFNACELSKHFYLIAIDTIGGPGKSIPNEHYGKGFSQVFWIDDILNELNLSKVNIAGVSNGAYLAQLYTAKRPEVILKTVCMSGSIAVKANGDHMMLRMMKVFLPEALFPTDKNIIKLLTKMMGKNRDVFLNNKDLMMHWKYLLKYNNPMAMSFHKVNMLSDKEVETLSQKILFIIGDSDPLKSVDCEEILKKNKLNYIMVEGAGHGVNHEFADYINKCILDYCLQPYGCRQPLQHSARYSLDPIK